MSSNRRRFLQQAAATGVGVAGLSALGASSRTLMQLARAAGEADHHFVFAYFQGGWDLLLGLDPRDPEIFTDEDDIIQNNRIQLGYSTLGRSEIVRTTIGGEDAILGPYIGSLAEHADKLAIVRGMSMETLTHEVGRRRFLTGKPPAGLLARGSSNATWLAAELGGTNHIPNLAVRVESYNVDQASYASALTVQSSDDLVQILRAQDPRLEAAQADLLDDFLASEARCGRVRHSPALRAARESWERMQGMLGQDLSKLFDYTTALATLYPGTTPEEMARRGAMAALRTHFFDTDAPPSSLDRTSSMTQAAITATALTRGISRVVSFEAARNLDTHFTDWRTDHGNRQMQGWDAIARLIGYLEATPYTSGEGTWLDHTTILCFSEFMRTPLINERGGRDHWLTNSCLLAGGGIVPGVLGASSDLGMAPTPMDLATGMRDDTRGEVVLPEHVLRTLMVQAGIEDDVADLRVQPIQRLLG
ncbi:MAG: DUF1501 domain-containing protein [Sandaracinus sp.]